MSDNRILWRTNRKLSGGGSMHASLRKLWRSERSPVRILSSAALRGRAIGCTCVRHRIAGFAVVAWRRWRPSVDETDNYVSAGAL